MQSNTTNSSLKIILIIICSLTSVLYGEEWQLIVMPKPGVTPEAVLISAYQKIDDTITAQLVNANFTVKDKSVLQLPECSAGHCQSITEQQLKNLSINARNSINLAVVFQLDVNTKKNALVKRWDFDLLAYYINLENGVYIDGHNIERTFDDLPKHCDPHCYQLWLAEKAEQLAQDMGVILAEKLDNLPRLYRYELTFNGFTPDELIHLHQYLTKVDGYVNATLLKTFETKKQLFHLIEGKQFRYVSELPADILDVSLSKALNNFGIPVLSANNDGRHFILSRNSLPYLAWYISGIVLLLSLCYAVYALNLRSKHNKILSKFAYQNYAESWLVYHSKLNCFAVPRVNNWLTEEEKFVKAIEQSKILNEQAWLFADKGDYLQAQQKVTEALQLNAENNKAAELKEHIVDYQRGYDRFVLASKECSSHPEQAKKLLAEAELLNPHLSEKIARLIRQSEQSIEQTEIDLVATQAQNAYRQGNIYKAYSIIDRCIAAQTDLAKPQDTVELGKLRLELDKDCIPAAGACIGTASLSGFQLFTNTKIEIGRKIADPENAFVVGYKRLSRSGKQLAFSRLGDKFYLSDQGSSNGSVYNDLQLTPDQLVRISNGKTLCLGGSLIEGRTGICQLETHLANHLSNALIVKLSADVFRFIDDTNMGNIWPTLDQDLTSAWIIMGEMLQIGIDQNGDIDPGCIKGSDPVVRLSYNNGFYLAPESSQIMQGQIWVDQQPLYHKVPLKDGVLVTIADCEFSLQGIKK